MKNSDAMAPANKSLSSPKWWGVLGLSAVLGLVFWLYTQPHLMIMLSDQLWACF
jgi:hypothetical protein